MEHLGETLANGRKMHNMHPSRPFFFLTFFYDVQANTTAKATKIWFAPL